MSKQRVDYTGTVKYYVTGDQGNLHLVLNVIDHPQVGSGQVITSQLEFADFEHGYFETKNTIYERVDDWHQLTNTQATASQLGLVTKPTEIITQGSLSPYQELEKKVESLTKEIKNLQQTLWEVRDSYR